MNQGFIFRYSGAVGRARQGKCVLQIVDARKGPHFSFILVVLNQCGVIRHMIHNLYMEETIVAARDNIQLTYLLGNPSCHRRAAEAMILEHHVV